MWDMCEYQKVEPNEHKDVFPHGRTGRGIRGGVIRGIRVCPCHRTKNGVGLFLLKKKGKPFMTKTKKKWKIFPLNVLFLVACTQLYSSLSVGRLSEITLFFVAFSVLFKPKRQKKRQETAETAEEWQSLSIMCLRDISAFFQATTTNCYVAHLNPALFKLLLRF